MKHEEKNKKIKNVIILLLILWALSFTAFVGMIIYNKLEGGKVATVTVPDNLITPNEDKTDKLSLNSIAGSNTVSVSGISNTNVEEIRSMDNKNTEVITINLYDRQPQENKTFNVGNMFPGDEITEYYRLQVSYHDEITVNYHADIRPGYEKLAEVLGVKIVMVSDGQIMYDGLMRDMPKSITYKLVSRDNVTDELYYEITAYLKPEVGNEYQNKDLIADFCWWVEETGNLKPSPNTGSDAKPLLWILLAGISGMVCFTLILTIVRRHREE